MEENKQDEFKRACAILKSLRNNIAEMTGVEEKYVHEFHTALDRLEGIGIGVSEFRIPDSEVKPLPGISGYVRGKKIFSSKETIGVDRQFMLTKLDMVLDYLGSLASAKSEKPKNIGFIKSDE